MRFDLRISIDEFGPLFESFKKSAFRIETLPYYLVDEEAEELQSFMQGRPFPFTKGEGWIKTIKAINDSGRKIGRVRVVPNPTTSYFKFELEWHYLYNAEAGEDVRFIAASRVPAIPFKDTWLFDDDIAVDLIYDSEGRFLYPDRVDDPEALARARKAWNEFRGRSEDLSSFLARWRAAKTTLPE
jgi:hypothetical protein